MKREITVTLKFTENDLNDLLEECYLGRGSAPQVKNLTAKQFARLKKELVDSADGFVEEIVFSSADSAANGWLQDFMDEVSGEE